MRRADWNIETRRSCPRTVQESDAMNIEKGDRVRLIIIAILAAAALLLWLAGR
jgi:hypothetical protein